MKPIEEMEFHPASEQLVDFLCDYTQNTNPLFFRVVTAHYLTMMASMMRTNIKMLDDDLIPVNQYTIGLATSGSGKGKSTNFIEDKVVNLFRERFLESTLPLMAEQNLPSLANHRAARKGTDPDKELELVIAEYERTGDYLFSFDSATVAAVKQARHKLLMANGGSMNLQIDEIGSNLLGNMEVLNTYLELFDVGKLKPKLVKNTVENLRNQEIHGRTPTNMLLFGTPNRLLNGSKVEEEFYSMLDAGYARRCIFAYAKGHSRNLAMSAADVLARKTNSTAIAFVDQLSQRFEQLADIDCAHQHLEISYDTSLKLTEYQLNCEREADALPEHEEMRKAEISHRHFKALKLAGTYAFVDGSPEVTEDHLYHAIALVEASGQAFSEILTRDKNYVKLAKYISEVNRKVTQADLVEELPFYKGNTGQKQDMMNLAIAYGYQNNIIIRKSFNDGIEFLSGETLEQTRLDQLYVSYSDDIAHGYQNDMAAFDQLHLLTQADNMHWCNHHFIGGYDEDPQGHRKEDNALPGFNLVVLDVDHGINLSTAKMLLKDYKALFYTTKRHTESENRFRIILPTNYVLKLEDKDYKEFMHNLFDWLPFEVDPQTSQRARKWLSHDGHYEYQDGELLDVLPFIPKTSKNEQRKQKLQDQQSLDNLERWVINNTGDGNRNAQLHRYAMVLVDAGFDFEGVRSRVMNLNNKLSGPLEEAEILGTVMVTAGKAIAVRDA